MGEAADRTILMRRLIEIQIREGVGLDGTRGDAEMIQQFGADQMGRLVVGRTHTQIDVGLTKIDRIQLGMAVGDVQQ